MLNRIHQRDPTPSEVVLPWCNERVEDLEGAVPDICRWRQGLLMIERSFTTGVAP